MISADIVLRRGVVMTLDARSTRSRAVAIGGARILALGDEAETLIGERTSVIDLDGRTVIPGLFDSHIHTIGGALNELAVSLEGARSIADMQAAFAARAAAAAPGSWIQGGSGWHESQLAEGRLPVRQELDAVAPDNPVIIRRGGHVVVVNSAALGARRHHQGDARPARRRHRARCRDAASRPACCSSARLSAWC